MRPLQCFNLATCTSELRAKGIVKRFRAFSELPLNLIGSVVLRTKDPLQFNLRPRLVVSFGTRWDLGETQDSYATRYDVRQLKRVREVTLPESFCVAQISLRRPNGDALKKDHQRGHFDNRRNADSSKPNQLQ